MSRNNTSKKRKIIGLQDGGDDDDNKNNNNAAGTEISASTGADDGDGDSELLIPDAKLPEYMSKAFEELYGEDGLMIMGRGMGSMSLLASLIRFYADTKDGHVSIIREQAEEEAASERAKKTNVSDSASTDAKNNNNTNNNKSDSVGSNTTTKPPLVIVLGLKSGKSADERGERGALVQILESWGMPASIMPKFLYNENSQGASQDDRIQHYRRGGVLCISSRILIVDLLTPNVLSPAQIDGFLVYHAENVTGDKSTEAFILRIYASMRKRHGFVKAISEHPDRCVHGGGFAAVDKITKACHVRKLYLYPRFHYMVRDELEARNPPSVTELHQSLSPKQKEIQLNILTAMKQCLDVLKDTSTLIDNKSKELTMENCLYLHTILDKQLKQDWHRLSPDVKQYIDDIRMLQTCLIKLITFDSISFWKYLQSLKSMSGMSRTKSMWIIQPAGIKIYDTAKERLYRIRKPKPSSEATKKAPTRTQPVSKLIANLEPNPKWNLLQMVLEEIQEEHKKKENNNNNNNNFGPVNLLVMFKDESTLKTVRKVLTNGSAHAMNLFWLDYLINVNDGKRTIKYGENANKQMPEEDRLLLEEEGRIRNLLKRGGDGASAAAVAGGGGNSNNNNSGKKRSSSSGNKVLNKVPDYIKKRRRIASEKGRGDKQDDDLEREAVLDDAVEAAEHELEQFTEQHYDEDNDNDDPEGPASNKHKEEGDSKSNSKLDQEEEGVDPMFRVTYPDDQLRVILKSYSSIEGDEASLLLQDVRPQYIVLYDTTDMAFIRSVEVYSSLLDPTTMKVRVYALMFEASAEEKMFRKSLEREKNAFERLIEHKKVMPAQMLSLGLNQTQEMQQAGGHAEGTYMNGTMPLAFDSRSGRGKLDKSKERRDIAVDVREFRAALPSILHQGGMRLAPVTLTVGDFVLSNVHCVEKKGVHTGDLFGSFKSGRLYTQVEAMCKFYKCPCLLIEFDPEKPFCLQKVRDVGTSIRSDSITSKLSLLAMHFPRLRILWSRGPYETLKIFQDLKRNHEEVDVDRAVEVNRSESVESLLGGGGGQRQQEELEGEDEINEDAREMLLRLPGVNLHSARKIMQECDSLAELSELSRDELRRIAGPITGQKLFTFFRQRLDS